MPEFLKGIAPKIFTDVSTFTAVTRWEQLDLDGNKRNRTTLGLNYRYTEDTVFKLDYQINMGHGTGHTESDDGNALLLGVATYF